MTYRWTEETVVDLIRDEFARLVAPGARGLIDDGAWLPDLSKGSTRVISCDAFQEGNDFLLQIAPVESAGHRAVMQNLSDIAAMGAKPVGFVWSLELPARWLKNDGILLKRFCKGAAQSCAHEGLLFYGGDLSFSKERFSCTITIFGDAAAKPLSRRGALPGDAIYVSRPLGLSSFGLNILLKKLKSRRQAISIDVFEKFLKGLSHEEKDAVKAHLWSQAETKLAQKLLSTSTACIDISDGLVRDLHRLCLASSVGAELENVEAAFHSGLPASQARENAFYGGEEFALLFTASPTKQLKEPCIRIGTVTGEIGVIRERHGKRRSPIRIRGYDHFTSRP